MQAPHASQGRAVDRELRSFRADDRTRPRASTARVGPGRFVESIQTRYFFLGSSRTISPFFTPWPPSTISQVENLGCTSTIFTVPSCFAS